MAKNIVVKIIKSGDSLLSRLVSEFKRLKKEILPEKYTLSEYNAARRKFLADHGYIYDRKTGYNAYGYKTVSRKKVVSAKTPMSSYDKYIARLEAEERKTGRDLSEFKKKTVFENRTTFLFQQKKLILQAEHPDWSPEQIAKAARSHNISRDVANTVIYPTSQSTASAIRKAAEYQFNKELEKAKTPEDIQKVIDKYTVLNKSVSELRRENVGDYRKLMEELKISDIYHDLVNNGMSKSDASKWMSSNIFGSK